MLSLGVAHKPSQELQPNSVATKIQWAPDTGVARSVKLTPDAATQSGNNLVPWTRKFKRTYICFLHINYIFPV